MSLENSPDPPPPPEREGERPMNPFEATMWAFGSVVALNMLFQGALLVLPGLRTDSAGQALCQVLAYLPLLILLQYVYFPRTRPGALFATSAAGSWVFYPIALLLGIAIHAPTNAIYDAALQRWPDTTPVEVISRSFKDLALWQKVATGLGLVVTTPLIEEAMFRGALFGTLRRRHDAVTVVIVTAVLFAFIHLQPQAFLPIGIVGASLAFLRVASGSMWPSVVMHAAFNGATFYAMAAGLTEEPAASQPIPTSLVVGGSVVTAGLLALTEHLRARRRRLQPAPEQETS